MKITKNPFKPSIKRKWIIRYMEKSRYLLQKQKEDYMLFYNGNNWISIFFDKLNNDVFYLSTQWKVSDDLDRAKILECVDECKRQIGFRHIEVSFKRGYIRVRSAIKCRRKRHFRYNLENYASLSAKYYHRIKKIYLNFDEAMKQRDEAYERCLYRERNQANEMT